jgi:Protein of unknown function (DUF4231)
MRFRCDERAFGKRQALPFVGAPRLQVEGLTGANARRTVAAEERRMPANTAVESRPGEEAPQVGQPALSSARKRLDDQIAWYDSNSRRNQRWFKTLKICQIVVAAAIPVAAAMSAPCG